MSTSIIEKMQQADDEKFNFLKEMLDKSLSNTDTAFEFRRFPNAIFRYEKGQPAEYVLRIDYVNDLGESKPVFCVGDLHYIQTCCMFLIAGISLGTKVALDIQRGK